MNQLEDIEPILGVIKNQCDIAQKQDVCDRTTSLLNLYHEVIIEGMRLQSSEGELPSISAAVRNIFELMLIIEYLASSDEVVKMWIGQLQKDALDIHVGLIALFKKHNFRSPSLEESRETIIANGAAHAVTPSRPFVLRNVADRFGWLEDYDAIYKLCSKILHPSSIKANLPEAFDKNDDYKNVLVHVGIHYLALIAKSSQRAFA